MAQQQHKINNDKKKEHTIVLESLSHPNEEVHIPDKDMYKEHKTGTTKSNPSNSSSEKYWLKTVPFVSVILVLGVVVLLQVGLYRDIFFTGAATSLAHLVRYPSAIVGTQIISYTSFDEERDFITLTSGENSSTESTALNKIARDLILSKGYEIYNVSVTEAQVEKAFTNLFGVPSTSVDAQRVTKLILGVTPEEIKERTLEPFLNKQALTDAMRNDPQLFQEQKILADSIYASLKDSPSSIADIASDKSGAITISEITYLTQKDAATVLPEINDLQTKGTTSIVESEDAFTFYLVTDRLTGENEDGYIAYRKIVIKKIDADIWTQKTLRESRVVEFVPSVVWSSPCNAFIAPGGACPALETSTESRDQLEKLLSGDNSVFAPQFLLQ